MTPKSKIYATLSSFHQCPKLVIKDIHEKWIQFLKHAVKSLIHSSYGVGIALTRDDWVELELASYAAFGVLEQGLKLFAVYSFMIVPLF